MNLMPFGVVETHLYTLIIDDVAKDKVEAVSLTDAWRKFWGIWDVLDGDWLVISGTTSMDIAEFLDVIGVPKYDFIPSLEEVERLVAADVEANIRRFNNG